MIKITQKRDTVTEQYGGVDLEIARINNAEFRAKWRKITRPHKRQIDKDSLPESQMVEFICRAMAGTVLVGWSGLVFEGSEIPFTEENAMDLLTSDVDCREFVTDVAGSLAAFLDEDLDDTKKKL